MGEEKLLTLLEVATAVGVKYHTLYKAVYQGRLPEPALKVGGRTRLYKAADIEVVREYFSNNKKAVKK